jgi:phosphohistidine phosphatase SixA
VSRARRRVAWPAPASAALLGWALALVLALPGAAAASDELWALLQKGGQVVMIRHAITTPGVGDPPGMRIEDCSSQRNLTDQGRQDARRLGEAFRARGVQVGAVLSSPWCRCIETARLAFGVAPETWAPLGNLFGRAELSASQVREMRARVGDYRAAPNLIMVTHGSTIQALAGINPSTAEMVILTPGGAGRFTVAGRLSAP